MESLWAQVLCDDIFKTKNHGLNHDFFRLDYRVRPVIRRELRFEILKVDSINLPKQNKNTDKKSGLLLCCED